MASTKKIKIDHAWMVRPLVIVSATALVVLVYVVYTMASPAQDWQLSEIDFDWVLRHLIIDVFIIEILTTAALFICMYLFAKWLKLDVLELNVKAVIRYQLLFLPLLLVAFFIINPITQSVRYWWYFFPQWLPDVYFESYFYSVPLYLRYLVPLLLLGYGVLNANLLRELHHRSKSILSETVDDPLVIQGFDQHGERDIIVSNLRWIEVQNRRYFAITSAGRFRMRLKLSELEELLPSHQFFRINRSVIVNWDWVESHAYWEHEKYVLRMRCGQEFTMTRKRWAAIKAERKKSVD